MSLKGQVICVVGASSGIGAGIAEGLYAQGAKLSISARRVAKLEEVSQTLQAKYPDSEGSIFVVECDVTQRSSVAQMLEATCAHYAVPAVSSLVCVAGVMYVTAMKNVLMDTWDQTIDVNCRGVTNCLGCVLPSMLEAKAGRIVAITSDAGVRDFENLAVYCASKRFSETLFEVTRRELLGTGVTLHTVQPGDVQGTEIVLKNNDVEVAEKIGLTIGKPYGEGFATRYTMLDPADIARAVLTILTAPPHVAINSILVEGRDQA
eukprot:Nitzschia sp. Nitz4//scaffold32_size149145//130033//130821//NITZ4_002900-RA/size149145-processed-gene-0.105-mRNA-1//1//CDS//3329548132//898//frame0